MFAARDRRETMSEREKLIDILVMSPMSDSVGPLMSPVERTATQILDSGWLASVKADAWDECAQEAYGLGWLHESSLFDLENRNPYRGGEQA
jgi:hypothetical protein